LLNCHRILCCGYGLPQGKGPIMPHDGPLPLLAILFRDAGNQLHEDGDGYRCGHLPIHSSESGECVQIHSPDAWTCWACLDNDEAAVSYGGIVKAVRSLQGLPNEQAAEAWLQDRYPVSLERFAEERCLPVQFLIDMGVEQGNGCVDFGYKDVSGRV